MENSDLRTKRDEKTINDIAEKLELKSGTNMVTKEELLHKLVAIDVIKNKMITVAGQMFIEFERDLDNSNQIFKIIEDFIGDNKIKNDILDKVCGDNINEETCAEKDENYENNSINRFNKN